MNEIKEYKPLELDYNVQTAVENLKTAYWSNEPEKVAKNFTEAEDIIISAICHHGYVVCKQPQGEWLPNYTSQFMNPGRQCSLCGKVVEFSENYCPQCGADMRGKNNV